MPYVTPILTMSPDRHSGMRAQARRPGIHNHSRRVMDSGLAALRRPGMAIEGLAFAKCDCPSCQCAACRRVDLTPKSVAFFVRLALDKEGRFAIVTNVGSGMRWTRRVIRRMT